MDYEGKIRRLCRELICAKEPGEVQQLSEELRIALHQKILDARKRIHEVAPILPVQDLLDKAS